MSPRTMYLLPLYSPVPVQRTGSPLEKKQKETPTLREVSGSSLYVSVAGEDRKQMCILHICPSGSIPLYYIIT